MSQVPNTQSLSLWVLVDAVQAGANGAPRRLLDAFQPINSSYLFASTCVYSPVPVKSQPCHNLMMLTVISLGC
eukprot:502712-Prorocentrum_minimum.AAC.1